MTRKKLLCIGNALVDIFADADEEAALRYGISCPVQHVGIEKLLALVAELPPPGQLSGYTAVSGGGAANVAKIAGFLGACVCFTGVVGNDESGSFFERELKAANVETKLLYKKAPTGLCLTLKLKSGEKRIAASPSASFEFDESDISSADIGGAALVVIDGFMLQRPSLVRHILRLAKQCGVATALDLASPSLAGELFSGILDHAQRQEMILFMNEAEAASAFHGAASADLNFNEEVSSFFCSLSAEKNFPIIVVKLAERGAICFARGKAHRVPTEPLEAVEGTGAGDAFCAGFLAAYLDGKSPAECASRGNSAARLVLGAAGTSLPSR